MTMFRVYGIGEVWDAWLCLQIALVMFSHHRPANVKHVSIEIDPVVIDLSSFNLFYSW